MKKARMTPMLVQNHHDRKCRFSLTTIEVELIVSLGMLLSLCMSRTTPRVRVCRPSLVIQPTCCIPYLGLRHALRKLPSDRGQELSTALPKDLHKKERRRANTLSSYLPFPAGPGLPRRHDEFCCGDGRIWRCLFPCCLRPIMLSIVVSSTTA